METTTSSRSDSPGLGNSSAPGTEDRHATADVDWRDGQLALRNVWAARHSWRLWANDGGNPQNSWPRLALEKARGSGSANGELTMSEPKLTFADLQAEAERLIATGEMPSLAELLSVVAEVREKYRPKILAARRTARRTKEQ